MQISSVNTGLGIIDQGKASDKSNNVSFGDILKGALDSVNEAQLKADDETMKFVTGESPDMHEALIAAEEARMQMELLVQVRNKLVESYQEITRMQL